MGYNPVNGFEFGKSLVTGIGGSVIGQAVRGGKVSYDTLLAVDLPAGTKIMTPRPVWSLFGRPGGGLETRVYAPVTSDMYRTIPAPS